MIGGVCAGLADYLRADVTVVRVVAALLAVLGLFTRGVLLLLVGAAYVTMWFLVPPKPDEPAATLVRA